MCVCVCVYVEGEEKREVMTFIELVTLDCFPPPPPPPMIGCEPPCCKTGVLILVVIVLQAIHGEPQCHHNVCTRYESGIMNDTMMMFVNT